MVSEGAADDCRVSRLDLPFKDGEHNEEQIARAELSGARLRKAVREHIVPRLTLLHSEWKRQGAAEPPTVEDIDAFGSAVIESDPAISEALFERMRERGWTTDELFENLLVPTARRLGELWSEDLCDFVDVAIGVNRLRVLLEIYACAPARAGDPGRRALLIATQQERHHFGLDVVASFLRGSGWETVLEADRPPHDNARVASESWFAVVGLTISTEAHLLGAARVIESVRRGSLNPSIAVIVGGWALQGRPDLVARIGGDASADDGPSAALLAEKFYITQGVSRRLRA